MDKVEIRSVSIIICCHNSTGRLPETLIHLQQQQIPDSLLLEVLIIDNASTDNTSQVAADVWGEREGVTFRVIEEPVRGLSNARNRGIIESTGDLICFIDDDIRTKEDWLRKLYDFALSTDADGIAGRINLPAYLIKPWMQSLHRIRRGSTESIDRENTSEMYGGHMAIRRRVLDKVPWFDGELGAGQLGFGEESLFSSQLSEAGYRIMFSDDVMVEHHFEKELLLYPNWVRDAQKRGESKAYIAYHWEHRTEDHLVKDYLLAFIKFLKWNITHPRNKSKREGCSIREMRIIEHLSYYKRFNIETKRKRNYKYHGLIKGDV